MKTLTRFRYMAFAMLLVGASLSSPAEASANKEDATCPSGHCADCDSGMRCYVGYLASCSAYPGCEYVTHCIRNEGLYNECECTPCPN